MEQSAREVDVSVELEFADLLRANLWSRYSKRSTQISLALTALLTLMFVVYYFAFQTSLWLLLIPLGLLLLDALIFLVIIIETRKNYAAVKDFQKQIHYRLNPGGYTARDEKSSSNVSWESVVKAVETKLNFHLFLSPTLFAIIPKRFFKTPADIQTTREILTIALSEKAHLR